MKRRVEKYCKHNFKRQGHEQVCVKCGEVARGGYTNRTHSLTKFTVETDMDRIKYRNIENPEYGKKIVKSGVEVAATGGRRLSDKDIANITQAPKIALKMENAIKAGEIPHSEAWRVASLAKEDAKLKGSHKKKLRDLAAPKFTACERCGVTFPYTTNPGLCPRCRKERNKVQARERKRRSREKNKMSR